jgi:predicted esterase
MSSFEKEDNIDRNNRFLEGILARLAADGIASSEKAILLGFSQGSSVAYRFAQAHPERVAGIVSVCADLPPDVKDDLGPLARIPVLIAYSPEDRRVGQEHPLSALDALKSAGIDVESFVFEGDHRVPSSLAGPLQSWADRLF